jgi:hypothetical protein
VVEEKVRKPILPSQYELDREPRHGVAGERGDAGLRPGSRGITLTTTCRAWRAFVGRKSGEDAEVGVESGLATEAGVQGCGGPGYLPGADDVDES